MLQRLGEKIRFLRKKKKVTLQELALILGINSHSYLSEIESGKKKPSTEMIMQIADLFQISLDQLMRDDLDL